MVEMGDNLKTETEVTFTQRSCLTAKYIVSNSNTHGTRTCIKRKKIAYGKFFDFRAQKCIQNQIPEDQNGTIKGF